MTLRIYGPGLPEGGRVLYPAVPLDETRVQSLLDPGLHSLPIAGGSLLYWRGGGGSPFTIARDPD